MKYIIIFLFLFTVNTVANEDIFNYDYKKECSDCIVNKKCSQECKYEPEKKFDSKYNMFSFGGGFVYTGYEQYVLNVESIYTYHFYSASLNYKNMFEMKSNDNILTAEFTVGLFLVGGFGFGYNFNKDESIKNLYLGLIFPACAYKNFAIYVNPFYRYNSSESLSFSEYGIMLKVAFFDYDYISELK